MSVLKGDPVLRYLLCSCCGCQWLIDRLACSVCGNKEQGSLQYFCGEGEEAYRIDLCDDCHHYIKTIDYRSLEESDPYLDDLATLHLDVVATRLHRAPEVPPYAAESVDPYPNRHVNCLPLAHRPAPRRHDSMPPYRPTRRPQSPR